MEVFSIHNTQRINVSDRLSVAMGAFIKEHPELLTNFMFSRKCLSAEIDKIFLMAHIYEAEYARISFSQIIGFSITPKNPQPRTTIQDMLRDGLILQVTSHALATAYGCTNNIFWRYSPNDIENTATLTIFENEDEFRQKLHEHDQPKCQFYAATPIRPEQRPRASM